MPAAAVIPAPRAYINVVAVKKPVVGFESIASGTAQVLPGSQLHITTVFCSMREWTSAEAPSGVEANSESTRSKEAPAVVTVSKTECSKQHFAQLNVKAWNDKGSTTRGLFCWFLTFSEVNLWEGSPPRLRPRWDPSAHGINRSTGGHEYRRVSGEILRPLRD